jgi:hypothetical protein
MNKLRNWTLEDILQTQGTPGNIESPHIYFSGRLEVPPTSGHPSVDGTEPVVTVASRRIHIKRNGLPDREWNQKLSHVRHDYVASELRGSTDMSLTVLGLEVALTPDCILTDPPKVLELATVQTPTERNMESACLSKRIAYSDILSKASIPYFIIVVSIDRVYSNCQLTQEMVDQLCLRCRVGLNLAELVRDITGQGSVGGTEAEDNKKMSLLLLSKIAKMPVNYSDTFTLELQSEAIRDNTPAETEHVRYLMERTLEKSGSIQKSLPEDTCEKYLEGMVSRGVKEDEKRVSNVPFILTKRVPQMSKLSSEVQEVGLNIDTPDEMLKILTQSLDRWNCTERTHDIQTKYTTSYSEAVNGVPLTTQHNMRKLGEVSIDLNEEEWSRLALSGVGAKLRRGLESVIRKEEHDKISFSPYSNTKDIETFINHPVEFDTEEGLEIMKSPSCRLTCAVKDRMSKTSDSLELWKWTSQMKDVQHSTMLTEMFTELSYVYKVPHKSNKWSVMKLPNYDTIMVVKCTGTHIFMFSAHLKSSSTKFDTGKLGPTIFETENYYVTDWMSFTEVALEHYCKAGPYLKGIALYLLKFFKIDVTKDNIILDTQYNQCFRTIQLLFYNNKADAEEIVTSSRYMYMRVMQQFDSDPFRFVERLPEVLRSRLSAYLLIKMTNLMKYYRINKPYRKVVRVRRPKEAEETDPWFPDTDTTEEHRFFKLRSLFFDGPLSFEQLVDSFYFGYVISKTKGRAGDRSFKIVAKICKEHFWFMENIMDKNELIWALRNEPLRHAWDPALLRSLIDLWLEKKKTEHGQQFQQMLGDRLHQTLARLDFLDIATLKASAKYHENEWLNIRDSTSTGRKRVKELKEDNPELQGKRPRVITALGRLIQHYMKMTGDREPTYHKVMLLALEELIERGWLYCDLFPKDQHGGDREIHVIEIRARVVHYAVEQSAQVVGTMTETDSICNPKAKDKFMVNHEKSATALLGEHVTVCKSADATKWCQRHHVSKFYFMLARITRGSGLEELYRRYFALWTLKRIAIPEDLVAILNSSKDLVTDNKTFRKLRDAFWKGTDPFIGERTILISSPDGMWQGITHRVSTNFHSVPHEAMNELIHQHLSLAGVQNVSSNVQGSDDSAMCISISSKSKRDHSLVNVMLKWKEELFQYLSIWPSEAKSSIGTYGMVEYNSEWWLEGKVVRPTFRWVSAALSTTLTETFYERVQTFYNLTTQCLETGGFTLTCASLQLCQSELHYKMLGLDNHILGDFSARNLLKAGHPAVGFFPLEFDFNCGVTGFDFCLFYYAMKGWTYLHDSDWEMVNPSCTLDYDSKLDKSLRDSMRSVEIRFGNGKLHERVVKETGLETIEEAVTLLESNPESLYSRSKNWKEQEAKLVSKLFDRGVKESLSSHQPTIRSFSSSSYMLNRPCFNVSRRLLNLELSRARPDKMTLLQAIFLFSKKREEIKTLSKTQLRDVISKQFLKFGQYEDMLKDIEVWSKGIRPTDSFIRPRGKVTYIVWGGEQPIEFPLMDIVRRQWFQHNTVHVSRTVFRAIWGKTKAYYRFLEDTHDTTMERTGLGPIPLHSLLGSIEKKERKLTLCDTTAKRHDFNNLVSRLYWPGKKLLSGHELEKTSDLSSTLMNDLYMTISSPLEKQGKLDLLSDILLGNSVMRESYSSLPPHLHRLKCISNYLRDGIKDEAMMNIASLKLGVLGYFMKRQDKEKKYIQTKGGNYMMVEEPISSGLWLGSVNGIPVRITMLGKVCKNIEIKFLDDTQHLASTLVRMMKEFHLSAPEEQSSGKPNIFLSATGNFFVAGNSVKDSILITRNPELEDQISENLGEGRWVLNCSETTIRLQAILGNHRGDKVECTILNHSFRNRDWIPGKPVSQDLGFNNYILKTWFSASQLVPAQCLKSLGVSPRWSSISKLLARLKNVKEPVVVDGVDVSSFLSLCRHSLTVSLEAQREELSRIDDTDRRKAVASDQLLLRQISKITDEQVKGLSGASGRVNNFLDFQTKHNLMDVPESSPVSKRANWDTDSSSASEEFNNKTSLANDGPIPNMVDLKISDDQMEDIASYFTQGVIDNWWLNDSIDVSRTVNPLALTFFYPVKQLVNLEEDATKIREYILNANVDGLSSMSYHSLAGVFLGLAFRMPLGRISRRDLLERKQLMGMDISDDESSDIDSDSEDSGSLDEGQNQPGPNYGTDTISRGLENKFTDEQLKSNIISLQKMLNGAPSALKWELELILRRNKVELNSRSHDSSVSPLGLLRLSEVADQVIKEYESSTEDAVTFLSSVSAGKLSILITKGLEKASYLEENGAISNSEYREMLSMAWKNFCSVPLMSLLAIATGRNLNIQELVGVEGTVKSIHMVNYSFCTGTITINVV